MELENLQDGSKKMKKCKNIIFFHLEACVMYKNE